jgi:hypothetical protein
MMAKALSFCAERSAVAESMQRILTHRFMDCSDFARNDEIVGLCT